MGAQGFAERARRELVATGETIRTRTPDARDELTPQEAQIARLASERLTNLARNLILPTTDRPLLADAADVGAVPAAARP
jgi:hypothetical protein